MLLHGASLNKKVPACILSNIKASLQSHIHVQSIYNSSNGEKINMVHTSAPCNVGLILSSDKIKEGEYKQEMQNHRSQTNPCPRKEETDNTKSHKTGIIQIK